MIAEALEIYVRRAFWVLVLLVGGGTLVVDLAFRFLWAHLSIGWR